MKRDKIFEDLAFPIDFSVDDWNALVKSKLGKYFINDTIFESNKELLRTEILNYLKFCKKPEYFNLFEWTYNLYKDCIDFNKQESIKIIAGSFEDI